MKIRPDHFSNLSVSKSIFKNGFHTNIVRKRINEESKEIEHDNNETMFLMMSKLSIYHIIDNNQKISKSLCVNLILKIQRY